MPSEKPARRRPFSVFDDAAVEDFCKARASGQTISAAAQHACVSRSRGITLSKDPEVNDRIRELRDGSNQIVTVSVAWVIGQLQKNATEAAKVGQFKPSNDALELLYEIVTKNKEFGQGLRLEPGSSMANLRKAVAAKLAEAPALPAPAPNDLDALDTEAEEVA